MTSPVETPLLLELAPQHRPSCAPEFEPLAGTGPDLERDEPSSSAFRLPPSAFEEQLPRSTFAPPPVDTPAADYRVIFGAALAELDRLEELAVTLRMHGRIRAIEVACSR